MRIMNAVLNIYKPQGMTPLQAIHAVREMYSAYRNEKMTYAGRLDPMAEGVLLVLVGDAVSEKETYCKLDKAYEADILFGVGTDTHDLLGMPVVSDEFGATKERMEATMRELRGAHEYAFPAYSSKPVKGKPLFQWARENKMHEIEVPKRLMYVHEVKLLGRYVMTADVLRDEIGHRIGRVAGDFRQRVIIDAWDGSLAGGGNRSFCGARVMVRCASGTYVRTLAHEWGKRLGTDAVLARLVRTQVGGYGRGESARIDNENVLEHAIGQ